MTNQLTRSNLNADTREEEGALILGFSSGSWKLMLPGNFCEVLFDQRRLALQHTN